MFRYVLTAALALSATPVFANDSIAELGTGGLILSRSDAIAMESEDLYISPEKVTVDYVFRNNTDKDVDAIVAFPMPDIEGDPNEMPAIPRRAERQFPGLRGDDRRRGGKSRSSSRRHLRSASTSAPI